MSKIIKTILLLCFISIANIVSAQYVVSGKVVDDNREPLMGAVVTVEGEKSLGTTTDINGFYRLKLPKKKNYTLNFSFVGFVSDKKIVKVDGNKTVNIRLQEDAIGMETVVVTGTRTPKMLKDVPIITRVIGAKDIQQTDAGNIADLLQTELPGVEFSFKMNQQASLNMAGFGGNALLFLIDGERLAGETMENVDYSRLNLNNVERIEIVKGASSSLYGSNAVGGVVNIITKKAKKLWTANINSHYEQRGDQRYGASIGLNKGMFSSMTDLQHTRTAAIELPRGGDFKKIYGNRTENIREKLVFSPNKNVQIVGRAGYYFKQRYSDEKKNERYRDFSAGLKGDFTLSEKQHLEVSYSYDQYDKSNFMKMARTDVRNYSNVQNIGHLLYNSYVRDYFTLTVGGDIMRDYLMSYQFEGNGHRAQMNVDAFAQADVDITKNLNVILGTRFDYFSDADMKNVSNKLALRYKWNHCSLRASYSGGFRAPTLKEMYMNFNMANIFTIYGNKDLKPERSSNFLLSAEWIKGRASASVTGFYNRKKNHITTIWNTVLNGMQYINTEELDIYGMETNVAVKYPNGFNAKVSYAYTHEDVKSNEPQSVGARPHTATMRFGYDKMWRNNLGLNLYLSGRVLSSVSGDQLDTTDMNTKRIKLPGYTMWKLGCTFRFLKGFSLTGTVDNLFNYIPDYYRNNSPMTLGTTFSTTLSVNLDELF